MKWLTKSNYQRFCLHPAYLWLTKHEEDKLPKLDEATEARFASGNAVDELARELFPNAGLIEGEIFDIPKISAPLLAAGGPDILLQAAVLTDNSMFARPDILVRQGGSFDLYEVKSANNIDKKHYYRDVAFQRLVFEEAGYKIRNCFIIHLNAKYIRQGELDIKQLFLTTDVTEHVAKLESETKEGAIAARKIIDQDQCPSDSPALASKWSGNGGWNEIYFHLHPDIPSTSIYNLNRLSLPQIKALEGLGVTDLRDIPEDLTGLKDQQKTQIQVTKSGRPFIDHVEIATQIEGLNYPLYFLDYETAQSAIPLWDKTWPWQQVPFQYSLHIQERPGSKPIHKEYLARGGGNPVPDLLEHLKTDIGATGTVIVYFKGFESARNSEMATMYPQYKVFLDSVNERIFDLYSPFGNGDYTDPAFEGSASIKQVLPALVPEMSYKDLAINKGNLAQLRWMKAALGELPKDEREEVFKELIVYCGQDTLAMVKIFEVLLRETELHKRVPSST